MDFRAMSPEPDISQFSNQRLLLSLTSRSTPGFCKSNAIAFNAISVSAAHRLTTQTPHNEKAAASRAHCDVTGRDETML